MIPEYPELKKFGLEDLELVSRTVERHGAEASEWTPANFYIWQDMERAYLTLVHGQLCALIDNQEEGRYFLEPLGSGPLGPAVELCLRHCGRLSRLTERCVDLLNGALPLPEQDDYLYRRGDLADMRGNRYDGKRNHIKRFKDRFPEWCYLELKASMGEWALNLFDLWGAGKAGSVYFQGLAENWQRRALIRAFSAYDELGLQGGAIFTGERMLGFIVGSRLKTDTAVIHFQYGHPGAPGVMPLLLQLAAEKTFLGYQYLNLEQDIGVAGLRKSKRSYHPVCMVRKYQLDHRDSFHLSPAPLH